MSLCDYGRERAPCRRPCNTCAKRGRRRAGPRPIAHLYVKRRSAAFLGVTNSIVGRIATMASSIVWNTGWA